MAIVIAGLLWSLYTYNLAYNAFCRLGRPPDRSPIEGSIFPHLESCYSIPDNAKKTLDLSPPPCTVKKRKKLSSYIRKFRRDRVQSLI